MNLNEKNMVTAWLKNRSIIDELCQKIDLLFKPVDEFFQIQFPQEHRKSTTNSDSLFSEKDFAIHNAIQKQGYFIANEKWLYR